MKCPDCNQPLGDNGFAAGCIVINCPRDGVRFAAEVESQRKLLDLNVLQRMADNEMPACFGAQRSTLVALAKLLMEALRQNEEMARRLGEQTQH